MKNNMMQCPDIVIVIATCKPTRLLENTLQSIAESALPVTLKSVVVAENGPESIGAEMVGRFSGQLPVKYCFFPNAKKCGALNRVLADLNDELIIYFDDDVRIHPDTLLAYAEAAKGKTWGVFFGGRCLVDYEEKPEQWLVEFLPAAAKGWAPAADFCELGRSGALGFNWAAFASDLRAVGGYDERCGPGTNANADEMNVQESLLRSGVKGYYLPRAQVWHYVPRKRCNADWVLDYRRKDGLGKGIAIAGGSRTVYWKQLIGSHIKMFWFKLVLSALASRLDWISVYRIKYKIERLEGKVEGMKLGTGERRSTFSAAPNSEGVANL